MRKEEIGIREIMEKYGEQYITNNQVSAQEKGLIRLLSSCGTHFLGSHTTSCDKCSHTDTSYNSCRNRNCPTCQHKDRLEWINKRMEEMLPVGYYHMVFTLPHQLNQFCLKNKKTMYDILFKAVSQTVLELASDPKHAGANTGLISVLHTWGQSLTDHIHLHCLMPAGGLITNTEKWLHFDKKDGFFVYYKVISRLFRKKFLALLQNAYNKQEIKCSGALSKYKTQYVFKKLVKDLSDIEWIVNIQAPMGNPEKIVEYLSRYVFRIAISNKRIRKIENGKIHFSYKDYRSGLFKPMKLEINEFIKRFLMHVLPKGFLKVRYYGIFTNRYRKENIKKAKRILNQQHLIEHEEALEDGGTVWKKQDTVWDEIKSLIRSFKYPNCPACKKGRMQFTGILNPVEPDLKPG